MLDPAEIIKNEIQKNFPKFGKIRKSCVYKESDESIVDTSTGQSIPVYSNTYPLMVIFDEFNPSRSFSTDTFIDEESVRSIDKIAIFPSLDLPIMPKVTDVIVDDLNIEWRVLGVSSDPVPGHYELHIRPLKEI